MGTSFHRRANFSTNETIHYHDDACLFRLTQDLADDFTVEANRPYSWRFHFTFGDSAKLIGRSPYIGPTAFSGTYPDRHHPLPPTFERHFNGNHYALVEYAVQAVFNLNAFAEPLTTHLPLRFSPNTQWPNPADFIELVRPAEQLLINPPSSWRQSLRFGFRGKASSSEPSVEVIMKASLNPQAVSGSTIPLHACIEIFGLSEESPAIPRVEIRIKFLLLSQATLFRARHASGHTMQDEYQEVGEDGLKLGTASQSVTSDAHQRVSMDRKLTYYPATFECSLPLNLPTTFRSFNINHSYRLYGILEASVLGKRVEHKFVVESLAILPA